MDQTKTGKFIQELRKEKNMTQQELAEKMGVSTNAVSKWERGLSFPDVSLFKKLCQELDISIEELINGQKDCSEAAKEKALISTIEKNNQIEKHSKIKNYLLLITAILIIISIIFYNKYLKVNLVNDSNNLYDIAINYLREEELNTNPDTKYEDFNVFYSYHGFGISKKNDYKYAYMWIYSQSYYLEEAQALAISGGSSMAYKFTFKDNKVVQVETPEDGNEYSKSVKKIFPGIIAIQVINYNSDKNINKLFNDVADKKNKYYDYLNLDMSKITIDDIIYNDVIFSINIGNKTCIPVMLAVFTNNKYELYTAYEACPPNTFCNSMLKYTKSITGKYDYDIIEIIKHSVDANNMQFTNDSLPEYEIFSGNGYSFITDNDNKYLSEFLKSIDVNLNKCAEPDYLTN